MILDLPSLETIELGDGDFCFCQSVRFESIDLIDWLSDLPKLQSIRLFSGALSGDNRKDRKTIKKEPYNYKNTLSMKGIDLFFIHQSDLPSLTSLKSDGDDNFQTIGSVTLESTSYHSFIYTDIPNINSTGILMTGENAFRHTYSLTSTSTLSFSITHRCRCTWRIH